MSREDRSPRRRRIVVGLGTTGSAAITAAFMSMGTASADATDLDPFEDALGPNANVVAIGLAQAADMDYSVALNPPIQEGQLDALVDAGPLPVGSPTDADAFEDLGFINASAYDPNPLLAALSQQLDPLVDGMVTPPVDTEPDPFSDALTPLQSSDPSIVGLATGADSALVAVNPTQAGQLDAVVDAGNLPTGSPTDADAFSDLGLTNGTTLDADLPTLAAQLDPAVDGLVPPTDADAFTDLAQAFDPNAFTAAGVPSDFIGTLAAGLDTAFAPGGFDASLDPLADSLLTAFGVPGVF